MIAMTQFHSIESMDADFGPQAGHTPSLYPSFGGTLDVEGYIHYHGAALVRRFDANSHLYLTGRWISTISAAMAARLARPDRSSVLLLGIRSDWLYPAEMVRELRDRVSAHGKEVSYYELDSPDGHDAFLKEWEMLTDSIGPFISASLDEGGTRIVSTRLPRAEFLLVFEWAGDGRPAKQRSNR